MKKINLSLIQFVVIIIVVILLIGKVSAATMTSSTYYVIDDSVNFGGTENSSSTNYRASDTLGEVGTGFASSTSYNMFSGYRTMQGSYISITSLTGMALPDITGMGGENTLGSTSVRVITDNIAGYQLLINANTSPALHDPLHGANFSDYTPSGGNPDYFFTVSATQSAFGFSPEGQDIITRYVDNGTSCNTGTFDTQDRCWDGFSTTTKTIAKSTISNQPLGTITTVKYKAAIGTSKIQDSGAYTAGISITAITL